MCKDAAIVADKIETGRNNRKQNSAEKEIQLPLHAVIDLRNAGLCLLLPFVVLHQQSRDGGTESGLARLQRVADLIAREFIRAALRQREHTIAGVQN